jgi:translocation and assembly module TamB
LDHPQANILVLPDGSTNVPKPKYASSSSSKDTLQTVIDLAVGRFVLANGALVFNSQKQDFDLRGESLRVRLWFEGSKQSYKGEISLAPLYVVSGRNTPVQLRITVPITLNRSQIGFRNASITTAASKIRIDGEVQNLDDPKTWAHIQGSVALADLQSATHLQMAPSGTGLPSAVDLDGYVTVADNEINVSRSWITLGGSRIEASGELRDPAGNGALQFRAGLAIAELGRLMKLKDRPEGTLQASGSAKVDAEGNYDIRAVLDARGLSVMRGAQRVGNMTLASDAILTPHRLEIHGFRIGAFGAEIAGSASMEDFARYKVNADLRHLDLQALMGGMEQRGVDYDGVVSGSVAAAGDLSAAGTRSLAADARLSIAPSGQGTPISGRLSADYRGDTDDLRVSDSFVALPHSRLDVSGSLGSHLNVSLASSDLRDFSPFTGGTLPVTLAGRAQFAGEVIGHLATPRITGHLAVGRFAIQGRQFDDLASDVDASNSGATVTAGSLRHGMMQAQFSGALGLRNWTPAQDQPVTVQASVRDGDLADVLALSGMPPAGFSGTLRADANVSGSVANPRGSASVSVLKGMVWGEPIDRLGAQVSLTDRTVTVSNAQVAAGAARLNLTAELNHPRDRIDRGQLHAHVVTTQVDLARLRTVQNLRPNAGGALQASADITVELRGSARTGETEFQPTAVTLDASGSGLRVGGEKYGDFNATARTSGQTVTYNLSSNLAGSQIRLNGNTELSTGYRTTAHGQVDNLPVARLLVLLKRSDIPARGSLRASIDLTGPIDNPEGSLDATVDRAMFDDEPVDRVHARVNYLATSIDAPELEISAGNSAVSASIHFDHPPGALDSGTLRFRINNGHVDMARIDYLQRMRPGLAGTLQVTADGTATVRGTEPRVLARDVNLSLSGKGVALSGKSFGEFTVSAATAGGTVNLVLDSSLAGASVHGNGSAQLDGDYPLAARMTFRNVTWKGLEPLLGEAGAETSDIDAATDGELTLNGPALRAETMSGRLQLSRVEIRAKARGPHSQTVSVENQRPVVLALERGAARIESLHLTGPQTDIQAHGTVSVSARTLEATVSARTDLSLIQGFRRDVVSSGQLVADATIRGTFQKPLVSGKLELHNASTNVMDFPAGLSNANGVVEFSGNSASFRNLNGEVGGGKVTLSGFVSYSQAIRLGLRVSAKEVRLRLQPGVDAVADADLRLSGRTDASILSGTLTLDQIAYAPQSDIGAILSRAAPPVQSSPTPSALLENMKLDLQVRTSSATAVQASVSQNLELDANLHIMGTASEPGLAGRISITEGKLVFFSSTYTVDSGAISFYNPLRIQPVLDLSLATRAKGVDVTLRVTGPIDNMKLSYTSDPPLQFQEIVGLLAAGQTPTSDPTLLANQPTQPTQTFQQMGESAVVSKALADPVASRLQRVFGITQLNINPTFAGSSGLPQAQLSLTQQVTSRITLTYTTVVDDPNQQAVSGNVELNQRWSAMAMRDQNGLFTVKVLYRKRFR